MINSGGIWYTIKEGVIGEEFGVFWVKAERYCLISHIDTIFISLNIFGTC
jgi:hypothetical protein